MVANCEYEPQIALNCGKIRWIKRAPSGFLSSGDSWIWETGPKQGVILCGNDEDAGVQKGLALVTTEEGLPILLPARSDVKGQGLVGSLQHRNYLRLDVTVHATTPFLLGSN